MAEALEHGMIGLNTGTASTEGAPLGGVKESSAGRERSYDGLSDDLETKLIRLAAPAASV